VKRDRRLGAAIALMVISAVALLVQAWIVVLYVNAAVMGNWEYFSWMFSVAPPAGPNQVCFDFCAAELPFLAGWVGIGSFLSGLVLLVFAWWKPRP
jgi:hypothetical protein